MTVLSNKARAAVAYNEFATGFVAPRTGKSTIILAVIHSRGRVTGTRTDVTVQLPDANMATLDSAGLRKMRDRGVRRTRKRNLTAEEQQQVRAAAAWVARRCPG